MKVNYHKLLSSASAFNAIYAGRRSGMAALRMYDVGIALDAAQKRFHETARQLLQANGLEEMPDATKSRETYTPEQIAFVSGYEELINSEVDLPFEPLDFGDIGSGDFDQADVATLRWLFMPAE